MAAGDEKLADPFSERKASIPVRNGAAKGLPRLRRAKLVEANGTSRPGLRLCGFLPARQGDSGSLKLDKIGKLRHGIQS